MALEQPFSKRNRYGGAAKEISIREDAPQNLRYFVLESAYDLGFKPHRLLRVLCKQLRDVPYSDQRYEFQIREEVQNRLYSCDWYQVYDFIETLYAGLCDHDENSGDGETDASTFTDNLNGFFIDEGIGWQLVNRQIVTRGNEAFEAVVRQATSSLEASERPTAAKHLHEALQDLSRRPESDLPGAVYHAMGSLECVMRDLTGTQRQH